MNSSHVNFFNGTQLNTTSRLVTDIENIVDQLSVDDYEEYDYDVNESSVPLGEVVPVGMVYGLTLLLGVVGNSLVIFSIARFKRMRNITNTFLLSLATADLILVIVCVPIKGIRFFTFTWNVGAFLCKFVHYIQNVSMICSVITLTTMSIERYVAILYPLKAKSICTWRHAITMVIVVWVLSFVLAIPILFGQKMQAVGVDGNYYWCLKIWPHGMSIAYELYMFLLLFVIPISVMGVAYRGICRELWKVMSHRATLRASSRESASCKRPGIIAPSSKSDVTRRRTATAEDDMTRKQVVYMLVVIVILFAVCWGPILINNLLVAFDLLSVMHYGFLKHMRQAFFLMSYFNSCVNPVVYGFMSKNFRRAFRQALCSCLIEDDATLRSRQWSTRTKSTVGYAATVTCKTRGNSRELPIHIFKGDNSRYSPSIEENVRWNTTEKKGDELANTENKINGGIQNDSTT